MNKEKIDRINELARLSKQRDLTDSEREEQATLRREYLEFFRSSLRGEIKKQEGTDNGNGN